MMQGQIGEYVRFWDFLLEGGQNDVHVWLDWTASRNRKIKAKFNWIITTHEQMPFSTWTRPLIGFLHDDCEGLLELRVERQRTQYRLLGFRHGDKVTLLFGALEKEDAFVPDNTCDQAQERKGIVLTDDTRRCEHDLS